MALDTNLRGTTGTQAEVDTNNNLKVTLPTVSTQAGFAVMASQNDAGTITGNKTVVSPITSQDRRLSTGFDTAVFEDTFNATSQNTGQYKFFSLSSLTATQSGGYLNINPTQVVTSGGVVYMQSYRHITVFGNNTQQVEFSGAFGTANTPLAGQIIEFGLFVGQATAVAPPDGVFFRYSSAGLSGIMVNNSGGEVAISTPRACSNFAVDTNYTFKMLIAEKSVIFMVDDIVIGTVAVPSGVGAPFMSVALPITVVARNTGTISGTTGTYLKVSDIAVNNIDTDTGRQSGQIFGGMGRHSSQGQNGNTMGSTSSLTNSQVIGTAAALVNTSATAPGAIIGLGGQATYLPTLTAFTDGILLSFQNPAGSVSVQPRTLFIGAIRINSAISATLTGGPLALQYSLAYGHTAVSLATAEATSFTTGGGKSPRRLFLGQEGFAAAAAIGTTATGGVSISLAAPICLNPGEFIAIAVKNVGVVTTAGSVTTQAQLAGWWE